MNYETIIAVIVGGFITIIATILANRLQWQSEKRREERQMFVTRVENMRNYLSRTVAFAAQYPQLMEFEKDYPLEGKRILMKLWFEDVYPLRTLFYERPELQRKLNDFDETFFGAILEKSELQELQMIAADISKELDEILIHR